MVFVRLIAVAFAFMGALTRASNKASDKVDSQKEHGRSCFPDGANCVIHGEKKDHCCSYCTKYLFCAYTHQEVADATSAYGSGNNITSPMGAVTRASGKAAEEDDSREEHTSPMGAVTHASGKAAEEDESREEHGRSCYYDDATCYIRGGKDPCCNTCYQFRCVKHVTSAYGSQHNITSPIVV